MNATPHRFSPRAILRQRCSECGEGAVFRSALSMNECCPVCGYKFERGPGYFTGAMYFSYALGIPIIAAGTILGKLLIVPSWPLHWILLAVWAVFLPLVPAVFRYSRVLFIHFDRYFDPKGTGDEMTEMRIDGPQASDSVENRSRSGLRSDSPPMKHALHE